MKLVKKIAVVAGVATIALTSVAAFAKGYFILNEDGSTYTTQNPASCPGITFPESLKYGEAFPNSNNQISINSAAAGTQHCVKTYDNGYQGNPPDASCVITLKVKHGKVVALSAHGYNTLPGGISCQTDNPPNPKHAHNVELLYSGS